MKPGPWCRRPPDFSTLPWRACVALKDSFLCCGIRVHGAPSSCGLSRSHCSTARARDRLIKSSATAVCIATISDERHHALSTRAHESDGSGASLQAPSHRDAPFSCFSLHVAKNIDHVSGVRNFIVIAFHADEIQQSADLQDSFSRIVKRKTVATRTKCRCQSAIGRSHRAA